MSLPVNPFMSDQNQQQNPYLLAMANNPNNNYAQYAQNLVQNGTNPFQRGLGHVMQNLPAYGISQAMNDNQQKPSNAANDPRFQHALMGGMMGSVDNGAPSGESPWKLGNDHTINERSIDKMTHVEGYPNIVPQDDLGAHVDFKQRQFGGTLEGIGKAYPGQYQGSTLPEYIQNTPKGADAQMQWLQNIHNPDFYDNFAKKGN